MTPVGKMSLCVLYMPFMLSLSLGSLIESTVEIETNQSTLAYFNDKSENRETTTSDTEEAMLDHHEVVTRVVSRTGLFLMIGPDGHVRGTSNCKNKYVELTIFAVGPNLVIIRGTESGLYLSMDKLGKISARNNTEDEILSELNIDILWREKSRRSCFISFQSLVHVKVGKRNIDTAFPSRTTTRFLTINRNGRVVSSETNTEFKSNFILIS